MSNFQNEMDKEKTYTLFEGNDADYFGLKKPQECGLVELIKADLDRVDSREGKYFAKFLRWMWWPGFFAVLLYRLGACLHKKNVFARLLGSLLWRFNLMVTGSDISVKAKIGPGLKIPHPIGIVIGPAQIGANVMILQNVTIGLRRFSDNGSDVKNYPLIGDNCVLCSGSAILGPIILGSDVTVGTNTVVLFSVPPRITVVGAPARFLPKCSDDLELA